MEYGEQPIESKGTEVILRVNAVDLHIPVFLTTNRIEHLGIYWGNTFPVVVKLTNTFTSK